jgi:hypothetical protein
MSWAPNVANVPAPSNSQTSIGAEGMVSWCRRNGLESQKQISLKYNRSPKIARLEQNSGKGNVFSAIAWPAFCDSTWTLASFAR